MATVSFNRTEFMATALRSPGYHAYADRVAHEITRVAEGVFNSRQRKDNEARISETSPPDYVNSWYHERRGVMWFAGNSDRSAIWVEFGALVGGNRAIPPTRRPPMVLKYRPLSTAIEIIEARGGV